LILDKLQIAKKTIQDEFLKCCIKTIKFDFNIPYTEEGYRSLKESLSKIEDVSVLVNNVGAINFGYFNDVPMREINRVIQVNCIPQVAVTKFLLPNMLRRSKINGRRCAIVNISSVARYTNLMKTAIYAATKSYNKTFSDVLRKEVGEYIDVMAVLPGPTRSNMITFDGIFVINPEQHVRWALSDLGYNKQTFGHYQHWMY
jgi:short-subunit dehydrogenase